MTDLQSLIDEIRKSTDSLYTTERTALALSHHLKKESEELIKAIESGIDKDIHEELADCLILILNIATKNRIEATELNKDVKNKLAICNNRTLGKPNADGVIEHSK